MRTNDRFAVFQDLIVDAVELEPPFVKVAVSDAHGPRGTVTYTFADEDEHDAYLDTLRQWHQDATPLTYVRGARDGVLVDDRRLLRRALEDPELGF